MAHKPDEINTNLKPVMWSVECIHHWEKKEPDRLIEIINLVCLSLF